MIIQEFKEQLQEGFSSLCQLMEQHDVEEVAEMIAKYFVNGKLTRENILSMSMNCLTRTGEMVVYSTAYNETRKKLSMLRKLYDRLADTASKYTLENWMRYKLVPDRSFLTPSCESIGNSPFWQEPFLPAHLLNTVVLCGDDPIDFPSDEKNIETLHVFSAASSESANFENICKKIEKYESVPARNAGTIRRIYNASGFNMHLDRDFPLEDSIPMPTIALDDIISTPISYILADSRGSDLSMLSGAKEQIKRYMPTFTLKIDMIFSSLWEFPYVLSALHDGYRYFLRRYAQKDDQFIVLYAIDKTHIPLPRLPSEKQWTMYSPGYDIGWSNHQLLKDCGVIPYKFIERYNCRGVMLTEDRDDYSYLKYLPGLTMEFLPDSNDDSTLCLRNMLAHLESHYNDMDLLFLYGAYPGWSPYLDRYRQLRPDGIVYLALDPNSFWMDRIQWDSPAYTRFLNQCDVIGSCGRKLQQTLSRKWPFWKIDYFPNGFFNATKIPIDPKYEDKENIILTVARLGTEQKANHIMMEAFANIADLLPDWKLHLVGSVEKSFTAYIEEYFLKYPNLTERVVFKGVVNSKEVLYEEYNKAKIFILTSVSEGGTPNVVAEALIHGCYMVMTDFDASRDATNNERCGRIVPINDVKTLTDTLLEVCNDDVLLQQGSENARTYADSCYHWDLVIQRLHHLMLIRRGESL